MEPRGHGNGDDDWNAAGRGAVDRLIASDTPLYPGNPRRKSLQKAIKIAIFNGFLGIFVNISRNKSMVSLYGLIIYPYLMGIFLSKKGHNSLKLTANAPET